jgi:hypothetical protein
MPIVPILSQAGVQYETDFTEYSTPHYVSADKIRFVDGFPEKIGGWESIIINDNNPINGSARSIFSYNLSNNERYLIGTHSNLYYFIGSVLTNISPLVTATTTIANSLDSNYITLGSNPITTVSGSKTVTVTDTATKVRAGDTIQISGSSAVNSVPALEINTTHFVRSQSANSYTFQVTTSATSSGSGGGGSVVQATPIITVNQAAHGFSDGSRIKIQSAATFAGILDTGINIEHIIRNTSTNAYDIVVNTIATSSVTGGGGAATTVQGQIADGLANATSAQGYGAGLYGIGLYGTALTSSTGALPVRSWVFDRFGNNIIMTPGRQTGVYSWDSDTAIAPVALTNAPTAVNYLYVSNNIIVTLGDSNVGNRRKWSDQGDSTIWTPASTNQAGSDDIEGAAEFISHLNVKGINLEFTNSQVYTSRYIGRPFVWETKLLDNKSGIISKNARVEHNGAGYFMGNNNFYVYKSGNVQIMRSNSTKETTLKKKVFNNINLSQRSKIFAWFNRKFNEIWFHIPTTSSNEPDIVVRVNVQDDTWVLDTMNRSAGEYPTSLREYPYTAEYTSDSDTSSLYFQEKGTDADGIAMAWSLKTNKTGGENFEVAINGIVPDSVQVGNVSLKIETYKYPQSTNVYNTRTITVSPNTEMIDFKTQGRYIQYTFSGEELGQSWRAGLWSAIMDKGSKK